MVKDAVHCYFGDGVTTQLNGEFHVTIPDHNPMKIGTFKGILKLVAAHHGMGVDELLAKLNL